MSLSSFDPGVFNLEGRPRVLVTGDPTFTNYQRLVEKVNKYTFFMDNPIICTRDEKEWNIRGECWSGADMLAQRYATKRFLLYRVYSLNKKIKPIKAWERRNHELISEVDYAIFFWDGDNDQTEELIELARLYSIKIKIVRY